MTHEPDCDCGIPEKAIVTGVLHVVEYIDEQGDTWKIDLSNDGSGSELSTAKYIELSEWGRMIATAPVLAEMVHSLIHDYVYGEGDDEDAADA